MSEPAPLTNRVEITGSQHAVELRVNGHVLPATAAVLSLQAAAIPVLSVALPVIGGVVVTLDAKGEFKETTRAALVSMGWTPPPEPGAEDEALPMRDGAPHCTPNPDGTCGCMPAEPEARELP